MNRRQFLRLATAAALSAGGIALLPGAIIEPARTIFLPPRGGWATGDGMWVARVVRQYTINNDSLPARRDVLYGFDMGAPTYYAEGDTRPKPSIRVEARTRAAFDESFAFLPLRNL